MRSSMILEYSTRKSDIMQYTIEWIKNLFDGGQQLKFIFFWSHLSKHIEVGKFVFSQWYEAPFVVDAIKYNTAEHWMMAQKARLFHDEATFEKIVRTSKPGEVKDLGRRIQNFDQHVWDMHKYSIVKEGNYHKFSQHTLLRDFLLNSHDRILVEASPVDSVWGIGLAHDAPDVNNPHRWKGLNLLGFALMEVRDELR